jgi:hypothetical protein
MSRLTVCSPVVWTDPGTVRIVRFHEASFVEDGARE